MRQNSSTGFSLIELVVAMTAATILMLAAGMLLLGSHRAFGRVYASIQDFMRQDARAVTVAFGAVGRKSNRHHYTVYTIKNGSFVEAVPPSGQTVAAGQAVEFRYWAQSFDDLYGDATQLDPADTGTHYALFYRNGDTLYVDHGRVVDGVGAIENGLRKDGDDVTTDLLVRNIDLTKTPDLFSHEIIGGAGSGCVNLHIAVENDAGRTVEIQTATLLRVAWPN